MIADYDAAKLAKVWTKGKEMLKKVGVGVEKWMSWGEGGQQTEGAEPSQH